MGAKSILLRYLDRKRSQLPNDPLKLREQLASVAEKDGLKVTEEELEEMTPQPPKGGAKPSKKEEGKRGAKSKADLKSGDNTKKEI